MNPTPMRSRGGDVVPGDWENSSVQPLASGLIQVQEEPGHARSRTAPCTTTSARATKA